MKYTSKINKVIDHITANLHKKITIEELAKVAGLSRYHFHRVFREQTNETIAKFIIRKRMEKAGRELLRGNEPVANIAYDLGYSSVSVFCRNFKSYFGVKTSEYRQLNSKNSQSNSKNQDNLSIFNRYLCNCKTIKIGDTTMKCTFEIKHLQAKDVIYYRHVGAYDQMAPSINKLMQWAYPIGLVTNPPLIGAVYLDDPNITPKEKLQSDIFLVVDKDVSVEGEIGKYTIDEGKYAVGRFEISMSEFPCAWNSMCEIITEHGCQSIDGFHHEFYLNNPAEHPEKKHIVDICIPVKTI